MKIATLDTPKRTRVRYIGPAASSYTPPIEGIIVGVHKRNKDWLMIKTNHIKFQEDYGEGLGVFGLHFSELQIIEPLSIDERINAL